MVESDDLELNNADHVDVDGDVDIKLHTTTNVTAPAVALGVFALVGVAVGAVITISLPTKQLPLDAASVVQASVADANKAFQQRLQALQLDIIKRCAERGGTPVEFSGNIDCKLIPAVPKETK